jgi:nucleoside-diphosphate-sugar epimerase
MGDFVRALARLDGAHSPLELPFWLTRLLGDVARNAFLVPTVTSNRTLRADLGWAPRFPTLESGLASIARR